MQEKPHPNKPKYLYHGSDERVDVLVPHQADDALNEAGSQYGVFATSNRDVALAFALGAVPDEAGCVTRVVRSLNPVKMIFIQGRPNLGGKGYLYTVSSEGFEQVDELQWVCRESVKPLEVLEISVGDYSHLYRFATDAEKDEMQDQLGNHNTD